MGRYRSSSIQIAAGATIVSKTKVFFALLNRPVFRASGLLVFIERTSYPPSLPFSGGGCLQINGTAPLRFAFFI